MNPAYLNQPPGPGMAGPAPMYGQRPPGPPFQPPGPPGPNMYNRPPTVGAPGQMKGPVGPPGPPNKGGMPPPQQFSGPPVQNGFQNGAQNISGPHGDQFNAVKQPGFPPGPPINIGQAPQPPTSGPHGPNVQQNTNQFQLTNQMNQMNIGQQQPPRPPAQYNSSTPPPVNQGQGYGPPSGQAPPNRPPGDQFAANPQSAMKPNDFSGMAPHQGMPPRPAMPPYSSVGNMTPRPGMPPTTSAPLYGQSGRSSSGANTPVSGIQPPIQGMPPNSMPPRPGGPPTSFGVMPPSGGGGGGGGGTAQQPGMPPSITSAGPPRSGVPPPMGGSGATSPSGVPPNNFGGMPPASGSGMPPSNFGGMPPTNFGGMPPTNFGGMPPTNIGGMPPTSTGGLPSPNFGGMPPTSAGGMPPTSFGGMPPTSAGGMPPTSFGGMPPTSAGGMPPTSFGGMHPASAGGMPPAGYGGMPPSGPGLAQPQMGGFPPGPPMPGMPPSNPGVPPGQNYQQAPGGYPNHRPMAPPQQPPRRLDPDQMPSPIQVIEDDKKNRSGVFYCNAKGQMPPLVTTDFIAEDQGNCLPRYIRSTMYNLPCTADLVKQCHIPMTLNIAPFARLRDNERAPPLVDLGELGPVRCNRCKAYMSPHMTFIDGGRRFQCCYCACTTEVPSEYFAHLDHTGKRVDCYERPELCLASYEFVATKEYCKNNVFPKPPAFIFLIDVSYNSVKSGLVHLVCERLKNDILLNLPREQGMEESEIRVGFATYTNVIHFYNVKGCLVQPQMMVVADVEDMFVPLVDGFLVTLAESEAVIDCLLEQIPVMWGESRDTETILAPVIQAGLDALKSADCTGKLFIFHSSLPTAEAPGKLKLRDDRKLLGTDKEKSILSPSNNIYNKIAKDCVAAGCGVDMFLFPNTYIDLATIGEVCKLTGGQVYKYTYFRAELDGDRFIEDLRMNVQRPVGFDAVMRVRTSTGIRPVDFLGNFCMTNTTDAEIAVIDSDKTVTLELKHDDKLNETDGAYIQAAILYTSITGQRRLRVHNLALNCCTSLADLFRNVETDVLINTLAKRAIRDVLTQNPRVVRDNITTLCANILACYRKNCASPSSAGQLILPECMKLLPLYSNCLIKSDALQGGVVRTFSPLAPEAGDVSTDDRSYLMHLVNSMGIGGSCAFFYPRLLPLHAMNVSSNQLPVAIRCSVERLQDDGAYLLENGLSMFLWLGHNISPEWVHDVFGVQSAAQIDIDKSELMLLENPLSLRVRNIIRQIRQERGRWMKLTILRSRDKLEPWFQHFLVEDRGANGTTSYVEFLCHIHKEIRNLLS